MEKFTIKQTTSVPVINIALDTLEKKKQALVFVNTKKSAEKTAEEIAKKILNVELKELSEKVLHALPHPTKQCERLAYCIKKGVAYHHAGLVAKQREIVEDSFRQGIVKIICATPTLAFGLNLPAYRSVIKDLKRFGHQGLAWIPVLEYLQQAGRAGRPGKDTVGEAIAICKTEAEKKEIFKRYILGEPERIESKLAVQPVLRMYVLSLIASAFCRTKDDLFKFFAKTFWAHQQNGDSSFIEMNIEKVLMLLEEWEFITQEEFARADEADIINVTPLGKRVSELYIDPLTAHEFIVAMRKGENPSAFELLHMVCSSIEMRPLLKVKMKEYDSVQHELALHALIVPEPSLYDPEYDDFLNAVKTAMMLHEWIEEKDEEYLLEKYGIRPGEIRVKLDNSNWLLYSAIELSKLLVLRNATKELVKTRFRIKYGAKEELFALLKLKNIGRVRARKMFNNGIKDLGDVKKASVVTLAQILGKKVAEDVKGQVG